MPQVKLTRLHLETRAAAHDRRNRVMQEASQMVAAIDNEARQIEMLIRHALGAPDHAEFGKGILEWPDPPVAPPAPEAPCPSTP